MGGVVGMVGITERNPTEKGVFDNPQHQRGFSVCFDPASKEDWGNMRFDLLTCLKADLEFSNAEEKNKRRDTSKNRNLL